MADTRGGETGAGVRTPWGDADDLRSMRMPAGRGNAPGETTRNRRQRLFGAMVAVSSEKGYEATTIGDLAQVAGVSRAAFYELFRDKQECLLAAVDALVEPTIGVIEQAEDAPTGAARVRQAVEAFLGLLAEQPAAAKMGCIEVYAAGPEGEATIDRAIDIFEAFGVSQLNQIPGREEMPPQMVRGMVGGLLKVIQKRLYSDEAEQLPRLAEPIADWSLSYPSPPGPLRGPKRRGRKARPFAERQAVAHPPERVLRALAATVAEKGYAAATVAEVIERAGTSYRVFYGHFEGKEEAVLAALDSGAAQMVASVLPAFHRARSWPESVRAAYEAMFAFAMEEPEYTRLGAVEMFTVGREALRRRDNVMEGLEALLMPGYQLAPETPPIAAEAIGGAIYALIHDQVKRKGPESLPELAPTATYMTLAPFLGAEEAYERSVEEAEKW
jgi:AcrR family transcriptional regulator